MGGVFLVARVAEARRAGLSEDEALAEGLARTGPVITSAAAIMIAGRDERRAPRGEPGRAPEHDSAVPRTAG